MKRSHKNLAVCSLLFFVLCAVSSAAERKKEKKEAKKANNPAALTTFLGRWVGKGKMYATAFSKAQQISSDTTCVWSPRKNYLVCDQHNSTPAEQMTLFAPDPQGDYVFYSIPTPGASPYRGKVVIAGNVCTYPPMNPEKGKPQFRTINTFPKPGKEVFKTEFSQDDGAHWTTMLEGTAQRVK